jgi:chemotaxis signal transduction protein
MTFLDEKAFVLFPLGNKRFALHAETVSELAIPDRLQQFPHCSPLQSGVLVRRGRIMPVCDAAKALLGPEAQPGKFYLIATRRFGTRQEKTAISVSGECELASLAPIPPTGKLPKYITGLLSIGNEIIEIVDLEILFSAEAAA